MTYKTAAAFRRALLDRLKQRARDAGVPIGRLQKQLAFDRFLTCLLVDGPERWLLPGIKIRRRRADHQQVAYERYVVGVQPPPTITYRGFIPSDTDDLVALWEACGLTRTWINSHDEIAIKVAEDPEGLMVAIVSDNDHPEQIVGSIMAGYDGHRGWINYLGVHPNWQRQGIARELMRHAEAYLRARGAPKINLQVRRGNDAVLAFYDQLGYVDDDVIGLGKRLVQEPDV